MVVLRQIVPAIARRDVCCGIGDGDGKEENADERERARNVKRTRGEEMTV